LGTRLRPRFLSLLTLPPATWQAAVPHVAVAALFAALPAARLLRPPSRAARPLRRLRLRPPRDAGPLPGVRGYAAARDHAMRRSKSLVPVFIAVSFTLLAVLSYRFSDEIAHYQDRVPQWAWAASILAGVAFYGWVAR
jgi:hypothetical protein